MSVDEFPPWGETADLLQVIDVEAVGDGRFLAPRSPAARREVVDGQQLLAQTVIAAEKAHPAKRVVQAHQVFSRSASTREPVEFVVVSHHDGRNFATAAVTARQGDRVCAPALVLLGADVGDTMNHAAEMPDVAGPDESPEYDFGVDGRHLRVIEGVYSPDPSLVGPAEIDVWVRYDGLPALSDRPDLHRALVAQLTGHFHIAAAMRPHEGYGEAQAHRALSTGNLSITITFHRDTDFSDWLLFTNRSTHAARGLTFGLSEVFSEAGEHVASYSVQGMVREFGEHDMTTTTDATRM